MPHKDTQHEDAWQASLQISIWFTRSGCNPRGNKKGKCYNFLKSASAITFCNVSLTAASRKRRRGTKGIIITEQF